MLLFVLLLTTALQTASAQPERGNSSIEGTVVALGSGAPIPGASVELSPVGPASFGVFQYGNWVTRPGPQYSATTSKDGKFLIPNLPAGEYRLLATQALGFVMTEYGQQSVGGRGRPLTLRDGQRFTDAQLVMTPAGSISGRLLDSRGEPLVRAQVQALQPSYRDGRRVMKIVQGVRTNDLGEYRLFWLPPGAYHIEARTGDPHAESAELVIVPPGAGGTFQSASPGIVRVAVERGESVEETLVSVYYPGTSDLRNAAAVDLHPGQHLGGLDFSDTAGKFRSRHIRGRLINGATNQPGRGTVLIAPPEQDGDSLMQSAQASEDGVFDIGGVLPGIYDLFSISGGGLALMSVEMGDSDVENLQVRTSRLAFFTIQGQVVVEGQSAGERPPDVTRLQIKVERVPNTALLPPPPPPMPGMAPSGGVSASGDFVLQTIPIGTYRLIVSGMPADLYLKAARMGASDVLAGRLQLDKQPEGGLRIVLSARPGVVRGRVLTDKQQPASNVTVALVPDLARRQRGDLYRDTVTDESGGFEIAGVAEGEYTIFAWEDVPPTAWRNADFMRAYETRGKTIRVAESSRQDIEVIVIGTQR